MTDRGDPDNCAPAPGATARDVDHGDGLDHRQPGQRRADGANGSRTTDEDTPLALNLAALATDLETADANLTSEIVTQPAHGTATATTYTPAADFNGTDSFDLPGDRPRRPGQLLGGAVRRPGDVGTGTMTITVGAVNDAPVNTPAGRARCSAVQETDTPMTGMSVADVDAAATTSRSSCRCDHGR